MGRNSSGIRNSTTARNGALTLSAMGLSSQDLHFAGLKRVQGWIKDFNSAISSFLTQGKKEIESMVKNRNVAPLRKVAQVMAQSYTGRRTDSFQMLIKDHIRQIRSYEGFLDANSLEITPQTIKSFASMRAKQILISQYKRYL